MGVRQGAFFGPLLFLLFGNIRTILGSGSMYDPPSRGVMWKYGYETTKNYNYMQQNCGGKKQPDTGPSQCGVCGDAVDMPRDHEIGGKYGTGTIARWYPAGIKELSVKVELLAFEKGYFEFRMCPANNNTVTQQCLDEYLLPIKEGYLAGNPFRFYPKEAGDYRLTAAIPPDMVCDRCVIQWRYHTANSWGDDAATGSQGLGIGSQEEFYNCADIRIGGEVPASVASNSFFSPSVASSTLVTVVGPTLLDSQGSGSTGPEASLDISGNPVTATDTVVPTLPGSVGATMTQDFTGGVNTIEVQAGTVGSRSTSTLTGRQTSTSVIDQGVSLPADLTMSTNTAIRIQGQGWSAGNQMTGQVESNFDLNNLLIRNSETNTLTGVDIPLKPTTKPMHTIPNQAASPNPLGTTKRPGREIPPEIRAKIKQAFQQGATQTTTHGGNAAIESAIMSLIMNRLDQSGGVSSGSSSGNVTNTSTRTRIVKVMEEMSVGNAQIGGILDTVTPAMNRGQVIQSGDTVTTKHSDQQNLAVADLLATPSTTFHDSAPTTQLPTPSMTRPGTNMHTAGSFDTFDAFDSASSMSHSTSFGSDQNSLTSNFSTFMDFSSASQQGPSMDTITFVSQGNEMLHGQGTSLIGSTGMDASIKSGTSTVYDPSPGQANVEGPVVQSGTVSTSFRSQVDPVYEPTIPVDPLLPESIGPAGAGPSGFGNFETTTMSSDAFFNIDFVGTDRQTSNSNTLGSNEPFVPESVFPGSLSLNLDTNRNTATQVKRLHQTNTSVLSIENTGTDTVQETNKMQIGGTAVVTQASAESFIPAFIRDKLVLPGSSHTVIRPTEINTIDSGGQEPLINGMSFSTIKGSSGSSEKTKVTTVITDRSFVQDTLLHNNDFLFNNRDAVTQTQQLNPSLTISRTETTQIVGDHSPPIVSSPINTASFIDNTVTSDFGTMSNTNMTSFTTSEINGSGRFGINNSESVSGAFNQFDEATVIDGTPPTFIEDNTLNKEQPGTVSSISSMAVRNNSGPVFTDFQSETLNINWTSSTRSLPSFGNAINSFNVVESENTNTDRLLNLGATNLPVISSGMRVDTPSTGENISFVDFASTDIKSSANVRPFSSLSSINEGNANTISTETNTMLVPQDSLSLSDAVQSIPQNTANTVTITKVTKTVNIPITNQVSQLENAGMQASAFPETQVGAVNENTASNDVPNFIKDRLTIGPNAVLIKAIHEFPEGHSTTLRDGGNQWQVDTSSGSSFNTVSNIQMSNVVNTVSRTTEINQQPPSIEVTNFETISPIADFTVGRSNIGMDTLATGTNTITTADSALHRSRENPSSSSTSITSLNIGLNEISNIAQTPEQQNNIISSGFTKHAADTNMPPTSMLSLEPLPPVEPMNPSSEGLGLKLSVEPLPRLDSTSIGTDGATPNLILSVEPLAPERPVDLTTVNNNIRFDTSPVSEITPVVDMVTSEPIVNRMPIDNAFVDTGAGADSIAVTFNNNAVDSTSASIMRSGTDSQTFGSTTSIETANISPEVSISNKSITINSMLVTNENTMTDTIASNIIPAAGVSSVESMVVEQPGTVSGTGGLDLLAKDTSIVGLQNADRETFFTSSVLEPVSSMQPESRNVIDPSGNIGQSFGMNSDTISSTNQLDKTETNSVIGISDTSNVIDNINKMPAEYQLSGDLASKIAKALTGSGGNSVRITEIQTFATDTSGSNAVTVNPISRTRLSEGKMSGGTQNQNVGVAVNGSTELFFSSSGVENLGTGIPGPNRTPVSSIVPTHKLVEVGIAGSTQSGSSGFSSGTINTVVNINTQSDTNKTFDVVKTTAENHGQEQNIFLVKQNEPAQQNIETTVESITNSVNTLNQPGNQIIFGVNEGSIDGSIKGGVNVGMVALNAAKARATELVQDVGVSVTKPFEGDPSIEYMQFTQGTGGQDTTNVLIKELPTLTSNQGITGSRVVTGGFDINSVESTVGVSDNMPAIQPRVGRVIGSQNVIQTNVGVSNEVIDTSTPTSSFVFGSSRINSQDFGTSAVDTNVVNSRVRSSLPATLNLDTVSVETRSNTTGEQVSGSDVMVDLSTINRQRQSVTTRRPFLPTPISVTSGPRVTMINIKRQLGAFDIGRIPDQTAIGTNVRLTSEGALESGFGPAGQRGLDPVRRSNRQRFQSDVASVDVQTLDGAASVGGRNIGSVGPVFKPEYMLDPQNGGNGRTAVRVVKVEQTGTGSAGNARRQVVADGADLMMRGNRFNTIDSSSSRSNGVGEGSSSSRGSRVIGVTNRSNGNGGGRTISIDVEPTGTRVTEMRRSMTSDRRGSALGPTAGLRGASSAVFRDPRIRPVNMTRFEEMRRFGAMFGAPIPPPPEFTIRDLGPSSIGIVRASELRGSPFDMTGRPVGPAIRPGVGFGPGVIPGPGAPGAPGFGAGPGTGPGPAVRFGGPGAMLGLGGGGLGPAGGPIGGVPGGGLREGVFAGPGFMIGPDGMMRGPGDVPMFGGLPFGGGFGPFTML